MVMNDEESVWIVTFPWNRFLPILPIATKRSVGLHTADERQVSVWNFLVNLTVHLSFKDRRWNSLLPGIYALFRHIYYLKAIKLSSRLIYRRNSITRKDSCEFSWWLEVY